MKYEVKVQIIKRIEVEANNEAEANKLAVDEAMDILKPTRPTLISSSWCQELENVVSEERSDILPNEPKDAPQKRKQKNKV